MRRAGRIRMGWRGWWVVIRFQCLDILYFVGASFSLHVPLPKEVGSNMSESGLVDPSKVC
jgi:hypothetical protein